MFTEGAKTEVGYLQEWHRANRHAVLMTIDSFHGVPHSLVERAVAKKKKELANEKRRRGRAYDEIWCVFDIDEHIQVAEAIQKANANGIGLAISNPCIELWFILHFEDQTAHLGRHEAQRRAREHLGSGKNLSREATDRLIECYENARDRARGLDAKHKGDGSPPGSNPSSGVWPLIESVCR